MNLLTPIALASALSLVMYAGQAAESTPAPGDAARALSAPAAPKPLKRRVAFDAYVPAPVEYLPVLRMTIPVGEIKMLPMNGKITRVALGKGSVLSTTTVDENLLVIAEQVGETTLMVWSGRSVHTLRIEVVSKDLAALRAKVDALLVGIPGIRVTQVGADLVLSGVAHAEKLALLTTALKETPNVIINVSPDQGSPYTRSVLFRLHFVEVKRSLLEQIGINWAKEANGPTYGVMGVATNKGVYTAIPQVTDSNELLTGTPPFVKRGRATGGVFLGLATAITSRINLGISDGDARVLASPELTAKNGGKAKLLVGGEVPIPLTGAFGATTVEFKQYGVQFAIEPQIDANDVITAKVSTELSQIDPSVSIAGIPGFITRSTATEVSVKPGEMVALSGLINSELSNAIDRVPGLSQVPIFGRLFRSDDFRNRKTELVVFLETEIISAGDGLAQQLLSRGAASAKEFEDKAGAAENDRKLPRAAPSDYNDTTYDGPGSLNKGNR
jgi:pilus assembly protein CpaC